MDSDLELYSSKHSNNNNLNNNYKLNFFKKDNLINKIDSYKNHDESISFYFLHVFFIFFFIIFSYNLVHNQPKTTTVTESITLPKSSEKNYTNNTAAINNNEYSSYIAQHSSNNLYKINKYNYSKSNTLENLEKIKKNEEYSHKLK